jgi:hypothetical protein
VDESANTPEHDRPFDIPYRHDPTAPAATALGPEIEDEGPEPHIDAHLDARVRDLLADAPDPGPMPADVSERISRALLDAARLRVDPGPLARGSLEGSSGGSSEGGSAGPGGGPRPGGGTVLAMPSRAERPKPIYLAAAVAAAVAVVAVGASALHLTKRPNGAAAIGDTYSSGAGASPSSAPSSAAPRSPSGASSGPPATTPGVHIQLSTTAYSPGNLAAQARALLDHPGQPIGDLAAESPAIGPIATPTGLESCLRAIGARDSADSAPEAVSADLATFDGHPAVVVVVTRAGVSTAWAVERSCTTGAPGVLEGPTPVR